jgi:hypothetical protein
MPFSVLASDSINAGYSGYAVAQWSVNTLRLGLMLQNRTAIAARSRALLISEMQLWGFYRWHRWLVRG